ncbi:MAG: class II aldolase/adducin family protein [Acidimicrobiia bacterium]
MSTTQTSVELDAEAQARADLLACLHGAVVHDFHEGIDNHFSLAVPGSRDRFLLNPYGGHWSELRAADLLLIDGTGKVIGEGEAETTAFVLHSRLHRARPDARCVLHAHMPYATAVSVLADGFDTRLSQNAMKFHGRVAWAEPYNGRIVDAAEGDRLAAMAADGARVVFLANHGVLVIAESAAHAWWDLYFLERACQVQVLASGAGDRRRVPEAVAAMTAAQFEEERDDGAPRLLAAVRRMAFARFGS